MHQVSGKHAEDGILPLTQLRSERRLNQKRFVHKEWELMSIMWSQMVICVTVFQMLLHSIVGCCGHFGHGVCCVGTVSSFDEECRTESEISGKDGCHGHHQHHISTGHKQAAANVAMGPDEVLNDSQPHPPCPLPHDCHCAVRCVYIVAPSVAAVDLTAAADTVMENADASAILARLRVDAHSIWGQAGSRERGLPSAMSLRALTQVWRI